MKEYEENFENNVNENSNEAYGNSDASLNASTEKDGSVYADASSGAKTAANGTQGQEDYIAPGYGQRQEQTQSYAQNQGQPSTQGYSQFQGQNQGQPFGQYQTQGQTAFQGQPNPGYYAGAYTSPNHNMNTSEPSREAPPYYSQVPPFNPENRGYSPESPKKPKKTLKTVLVSILALAVVAGFCFGGYLIGSGRNNDGGASGRESYVSDDSSKEETSIPEVVTYSRYVADDFDGLIELYNKCAQSCVSIKCKITTSYFGYSYENTALGSGFIVSDEGYIVTNHHVIENASEIKVVFYDGEEVVAKLIGSDSVSDIAVLKIEHEGLVAAEIGDSSALQVGEAVIAIGTPSSLKLAGTMSYGYISGLNREIDITNDYGKVVKTMKLIQTSATLNPGNSGGPLINLAGQVVGINALKLSSTYEGIGFSLPMTEATVIINTIIAGEDVTPNDEGFAYGTAHLGITGGTITDAVRKNYGLSDECPDGVLVTQVNRGTAIYQAGLSVFDVITEFNGNTVKTMDDLKKYIAECKAGQEVTMTFYRPGRTNESGKTETVTFQLDYVS